MKIIKVENLSKAYRIGLKEKRSDTLGGAITSFIKKPINNFKRLRNLSNLNEKSKDADVFWALKDINFEVEQGDILGIIGKNGAGKSTLLKILSRITEPTTGQIEINGRVASLLEVGTGFNPELTGRENTYLNGTILGMRKKEIDSKFDAIVDFSGVEKFIDTPVKRYSSGMRVRLAFAVAAFLEPEILIIDEVLAVGDAEFQKKCLGKMQDISQGEGRTVLFVSHNMTAVRSLCKSGIYLENGYVKENGNLEHVINKYFNVLTDTNFILNKNIELENEYIFIKNISYYSGNKQINNGKFEIDKPNTIKIEFDNKSIRGNFNINLLFNSPDGYNIFTVCSPVKNIDIGYHQYNCIIPENFLNDVVYYISVMFVNNANPILNFDNLLTIEGLEPPRVGSWLGKFPGLIKPKFQWNYNL
ncbi:MAG TPA: ABC transporter ATP-binding protein [Ignavibacteria bacterium]|nr:ABC transporter ATP-binding protein [Ignavibacteria bacterium]